jgi:hypothetical protein
MMKRDQDAQVQVIESIIVGILVFVAIAIAAVFRVPTIGGTFEQSELERLGTDVLSHLAAAVPRTNADCNETPCPFESELDRMLSLAIRYQGATVLAAGAAETRDVSPLTDYFNQSLPDGARYLITYSNGVNATRIFPMALNPPALDVVVSHAIVAPNWMAHAQQASTSALVQIGEITGFVTASTNSIRDPLNRDREEWGDGGGNTYVSLLSNAGGTKDVPVSAVYGTYKLCPDVACTTPSYFTVVPPGVYGAGSSILLSDRDNSTSLVAKDSLFNLLKFTDTTNTALNLLDSAERLYLDFDGSNTVTVGDLRMSDYALCQGASTSTCVAGSFVKTLTPAQADIGTALEAFPVGARPTVRAVRDAVNPLVLESGESLYLDVNTALDTNGDEAVGLNDRRLSRVGTFRMGSVVAATDFDAARSLTQDASPFSATSVYFADTDLDGVLDPEEPIYLDLVGNGQDAGIESLDLRLSPRGSPNLRYAYDVQAVIWFGI